MTARMPSVPDPVDRAPDAASSGAAEVAPGLSAPLALSETQLAAAAAMFRALADPARLQTLALLLPGEASVSRLAAAEGGRIGTVSARLRVLHDARLVRRRRDGRRVLYALADTHVLRLVQNAIDHACEAQTALSPAELSAGPTTDSLPHSALTGAPDRCGACDPSSP